MKKISILGSTGSIGESTLKLVAQHRDQYEVVGLSAGKNWEKLAAQIRAFQPKCVSLEDESHAQKLRDALRDEKHQVEFYFGPQGAQTIASLPENDTVISAIVGSAGLAPTLAAIRASKTVGLANKESLVVAGAYMMEQCEKHQSTLLPVDSEHAAIFQCLGQSCQHKQLQKVLLTASGGPFFKQPDLDFASVRVADALKHPNWSMGKKITIDSATMFNKGFEAIEAKWFFNLSHEQLDVVVHPQSIVHSMVEFEDGSVLAQMGVPDMQGPISHALAHPHKIPNATQSLDFSQYLNLEFFAPDHQRFPSIPLALETLKLSPLHPAVLNGANEVTVDAFLQQKIGFQDIFRINREAVSRYVPDSAEHLEDFVKADQWGRLTAEQLIT